MDEISSFLLSVIESSSDAIVGLKLDGIVISWNSGAERIYGRPASEMVGKPITRLSLPDRSDETPLILARIFNGERIRHFQTTHLKNFTARDELDDDTSLMIVKVPIRPQVTDTSQRTAR